MKRVYIRGSHPPKPKQYRQITLDESRTIMEALMCASVAIQKIDQMESAPVYVKDLRGKAKMFVAAVENLPEYNDVWKVNEGRSYLTMQDGIDKLVTAVAKIPVDYYHGLAEEIEKQVDEIKKEFAEHIKTL